MMATTLRLRTEVDISEAEGRAELSIWLNNEAEAYTIRVTPLDDEQREQYDASHKWDDGYTGAEYADSFDEALSAAWDAFAATMAQNFDEARGIE